MIESGQPGGEQAQPEFTEASSSRLQVLATEHWSLLATRSLTYTESFSRVSMFLSVLTGAVISLSFLGQFNQGRQSFQIVAVLILSVVLFVGLATVGRLAALNREDARWVMGMNRLRRAYLEAYPELEPYFITGSHDDQRGLMLTFGTSVMPGRGIRDFAHGMQTLPAMVSVIVSVVAGVWAALIAGWVGLEPPGTVAVGVVFFLATVVLLGCSRAAAS